MAETIEIQVSEIDESRGGNIVVYVFGEEGYPKQHDKALHVQIVEADKSELNFRFDVSVDHLALKVLHDEDGSGEVTKNWTGVYPAEGLGFSNDQKLGTFGPPTYEASKVERSSFARKFVINVTYP